MKRLVCILGLCVWLGGCAGSAHTPASPTAGHGLVRARSDLESRVLQGLQSLRGEGAVPGVEAEAQSAAPYHAASGRLCRRLTMTAIKGPGSGRLACRDKSGWAYSPRVEPVPRDQAGSP